MSLLRRSAWAGVIGPVTFVAGWVTAGAATPGYSPTAEPISDLAAAGAPHRLIMNAGFATFAAAMPLFALTLRRTLPGPSAPIAVAIGVATAAVGLAPLGYSQHLDTAHGVAAFLAYVGMAALPLAAARPLARAGRRRAARISTVVGFTAGLALAASGITEAVGLYQRTGLTLVHIWIAGTAIAILRQRL